jgi:putative ABC transport system permease protein
MRLTTIAFNNLRRRKARLAFLLAGLLIGVATVVTLVVLTDALTMDAQHKLENFGANILITPRSDELSLSYGGITLGGVSVDTQEISQESLVKLKDIRNARNIAAVAPKVIGGVAVGDQRVLLMGVDLDKEFTLKRWWTIDGRAPAADDELVAGSAAAERLGLQMGEVVAIDGRNFTLTGIIRSTGSQDDQLLVSSLASAQRLLGKAGQVSLVEVAALCADCPVEDMVNQISEVLPGVQVNAIQQVVKTRMHAIGQFRNFSLGVAGVVLLVGALVVFVTMMGSVNERTREIGIFRALGFRRQHIIRLILTEAGWVSFAAGLLGWLSGVAAAYLLMPLLSSEGGHMALAWQPWLAGAAIMLAVCVGTLASFYPALRASRMEPAEALRTI